jgi:hypothetical protein
MREYNIDSWVRFFRLASKNALEIADNTDRFADPERYEFSFDEAIDYGRLADWLEKHRAKLPDMPERHLSEGRL